MAIPNEHILKLEYRMEQLVSLMEVIDIMLEKDNVAAHTAALCYLLQEQIKQVQSDVIALEGHCRVCDAVWAVNHVEELQAENEALRAALIASRE